MADQTSPEAAPVATPTLVDLKVFNQAKDMKAGKDSSTLKENLKDEKHEPEHNLTQTVAAARQTPPAPLPVLDWALPVPVTAVTMPEDTQSTKAPDPTLSDASVLITQTPLPPPTAALVGKPKVPADKQEELLSSLQISEPAAKGSSEKMALAFGATLTEQQKNATEASTPVTSRADGKPSSEAPVNMQQQSANSRQSEVSSGLESKDIKQKAQPINAQLKPELKAQASVEPEARTSRGPEPVTRQAEPVFTPASTAIAKPVEHATTKEVKSSEPVTHLETLDAAPPRTEPARDISFRIAAGSSDAVDVKLVDRGGQIHVAVRSADAALTKSLQSNVTELAQKLERSGFHTETSIPGHSEPVRQTQQGQAFQDSSRDRRAPQQDQQRPKKRLQPSEAVFSLNALQPTQQENQ